MKEGADVNSRNSRGATPLIVATAGQYTKSMELLIELGADVNVVVEDWYDRNDPTAIHQATKEESGKCMELLIAVGADVNICANTATPLIASSIKNNIVCAKLLLKAGALVNLKSKDGFNATQCFFLKHSNNEKAHEFLTLLFAAGDSTERTFTYHDSPVDIFRCLRELMEPDNICLDDICRRGILNHLLNLNSSENLFVRIPRLGLPATLE